MSERAEIIPGTLKLKGIPMKKKKKKGKEIKNVNKSDLQLDVERLDAEPRETDPVYETREKKTDEIHLTKAELAFRKRQKDLQLERIMQKASKSHRQMVEEFNNKLDSMSEHYDIPKVSWTK